MKKTALLFISLTLTVIIMAQEPAKQHEIGLSFYSLNGFGANYKTGTEKSLWRFNSLVISSSKDPYAYGNYIQELKNTRFGVSFGKEFRKEIAENFELRYGADLSFGYIQNKNRFEYTYSNNYYSLSENESFVPGLNFVLGINYLINDKFVIGAELLPGFSYSFGKGTDKDSQNDVVTETKFDSSGYNLGISSSSALLSIAYRF